MKKLITIFKIIFIFLFLINLVEALEVSTNAVLIGDTYYISRGEVAEITLLSSPLQELQVSIDYYFSIPSSNNQYFYSQDKFPIPLKAYFEIKTWPVENLTVEARLWIFSRKLQESAVDGVAKIGVDVPFAGNFDVKIYGASRGEVVNVEAKARAKIKLDENGKYTVKYDTSKLPFGEMLVEVDSKQLRVKVVDRIPEKEKTVEEKPKEEKQKEKPDIRIRNLKFEPEMPETFQDVKIEVELLNAGRSDIDRFYVTFHLNSEARKLSVDRLKVGEIKVLTLLWKPKVEGKYFVTIFADEEDFVEESDEENNQVSAIIEVLASKLNIDLELEVPDTAFKGEEVEIIAKVSNFGKANLTSFNLSFYVEKILLRKMFVDELKAGEKKIFTLPWIPEKEGDYVVGCSVDIDGLRIDGIKVVKVLKRSEQLPVYLEPEDPFVGQKIKVCTVLEKSGRVKFYINDFYVEKEAEGNTCIEWIVEDKELNLKVLFDSSFAERKVIAKPVEVELRPKFLKVKKDETFEVHLFAVKNLHLKWYLNNSLAEIVYSDKLTDNEGKAKLVLKAKDPGFLKVKAEIGNSFAESIVEIERGKAIPGFEILACLVSAALAFIIKKLKK